MSFFNWTPSDSAQIISPWVALYFVLTLIVTALTVWRMRKWMEREEQRAIKQFLEDIGDAESQPPGKSWIPTVVEKIMFIFNRTPVSCHVCVPLLMNIQWKFQLVAKDVEMSESSLWVIYWRMCPKPKVMLEPQRLTFTQALSLPHLRAGRNHSITPKTPKHWVLATRLTEGLTKVSEIPSQIPQKPGTWLSE